MVSVKVGAVFLEPEILTLTTALALCEGLVRSVAVIVGMSKSPVTKLYLANKRSQSGSSLSLLVIVADVPE